MSLSSHPDLTPYASAQAAQDTRRIQANMAQTLPRLMTKNCARETKQTLRKGGPAAMQDAFTTVAHIDPGRWARLLLMP